MKSTQKLCLVLATIFFTFNNSTAQQFNWAPTVKIKNNFYHYYIGESGSGSVLLTSKYTIRKDFRQNQYNYSFKFNKDNEINLVRFDKNHNLKSETPFTFKNTLSVFYDAFISDNIYFIYSSIKNNKCVLFADVYSTDDKYIRTETLKELTKYSSNENDVAGNFTIVPSENHQFIAIQDYGNMITFYDSQLKKVWEFKFQYKFLTDMKIQDDGKAFAIGGTDKSASLLAFDLVAKKVNTADLNIDRENSVEDLCLTADQKQNIIYVTYFYGVQGDKIQFYFGPSRHIEFFANGLFAEMFDMTTLVSKKKTKVPFSTETLMKVSEKKKVEKLKGLEWFSNKNMFITENGELIVVLEKEYNYSRTTSDQYGRVLRVENSTVDEDIITVRIKNDGTSLQNVIKRKTKGETVYDYMFSCASFYENGKLYIMYNEGSSWYRLYTHVLSENLEETAIIETKTAKEHDVYLAIRNTIKMKDGNYKVFGKEGKNVTSVVLKFK